MDLLFIKIKLKQEVQTKDVYSLVERWLLGSPHYNIVKINYNNESEFKEEFESSKISIIRDEIKGEKIFACRFSHKDKNQIWETDCIFNEISKSFSVRLSCTSKAYCSSLPRIHKPQIIKQLFDLSMVDSMSELQTSDKAIYLENTKESITKCARIMNGDLATELPVVYISYDAYGQSHYYVDPNILAIKLSGQAHVLVEPCKEFGTSLKNETEGKNVYWGFIGIYFPGMNLPLTFSPYQYMERGIINQNKMSNAIRVAVQQATLNHYSTNDLTWEKVLTEIHKKKMFEQEEKANYSKKELDDYVNSFDRENEKLKEEVERLRTEIDIQSQQLEGYKRRYEGTDALLLKSDFSNQYYINEYYDFVINLLELANNIIPKDNRGKEIVENLLLDNQSTQTCKAKMESIKNALNEKSIDKRRNALERCGFIVEKGSHDKIVFYNPKYTFSLSNSPSDYRESKNLYSDIAKRIDVTKKYF